MSDVTRDEALGSALRALEVPEHGPGFESALRRALAARSRRRWLTFPRLVPLGAAAAAVVAVAVVLLVNLSRSPAVASAAEVRAAVAGALSEAQAISGVVVNGEREQGGGLGEVKWSFVLTDRGDFRLTGLGTQTDLAYDADENVERYFDTGYLTIRTGLAPGPPDSGTADYVVQRGLGSAVRALSAAGDPDVVEVTFNGRDAWLLRTGTGNPGETREITVERESGVPVRDVRRLHGSVLSEWRIDDLHVDPRVSPDAFRLESEPTGPVTRYDMGFRRVTLADAARLAGYRPLVPTRLPLGFQLAEVAFAERSRPTGSEQRQNPESRKVVSLAYRHGLDEVVVTTRLRTGAAARWRDPVAVGLLARGPQPFHAAAGPLAGNRAEIVIDPNVVPHVWGLTGRLVVTIAGDVDRAELSDLARSLAPAAG
jgi:hypothetical protein